MLSRPNAGVGFLRCAHDHLDSSSQFVLAELVASDAVDGCLVQPVDDLDQEWRHASSDVCPTQIGQVDFKPPDPHHDKGARGGGILSPEHELDIGPHDALLDLIGAEIRHKRGVDACVLCDGMGELYDCGGEHC